MKTAHLVTAMAMLFLGCESKSPQEEPRGARAPKTSYGEAVKRGKDLGAGMEQRDEEVDEQARELGADD